MLPLQLWGGVECTVNRVQDTYLDQCRLSGHHDRIDDLDLCASLGLAAMRYPLLWERAVRRVGDAPDWRWTDQRMDRLRALGIRPIAGLVHHGSGPLGTHLLDDGFAAGLGRYAGQVATRYPWIDAYTPINEPLTTARFACLYGHWYPHVQDEALFWRALLNQVDATRSAMRAIRRINPAARLVQTDDLGRTYASSQLADQAGFDNVRRWAGWDLLFGRLTRYHPLWDRLARFGLAERLRAIANNPCPPDVVGVNHYLTSDRILDHQLQLYPPRTHGSNGRIHYADVEAVRVLEPAPAGFAGALREAWERYRVPLALTEVHNGSVVQEQVFWAKEAWEGAQALRATGVKIEAVTAWSLFGSYGWDTLVTAEGSYEPGVFDVSTGQPQPTELTAFWRGLQGRTRQSGIDARKGWWRQPDRLLYPPRPRPAPMPAWQ